MGHENLGGFTTSLITDPYHNTTVYYGDWEGSSICLISHELIKAMEFEKGINITIGQYSLEYLYDEPEENGWASYYRRKDDPHKN